MENRRASYGVLVSRNRDALAGEVGWFNEYDGNRLVWRRVRDGRRRREHVGNNDSIQVGKAQVASGNRQGA